MMSFKDYFWRHIWQGLFLSWIILSGISIIVYGGTIVFFKNKQITSSLNLSAHTVREAMQAEDWPLALSHLMKLEETGPVFHIKLTGKLNDQGSLTGPFGDEPFGIGSFCKEVEVTGELKLNGCMKILGSSEILTLFLFVLFSSGMSFFIFKMFRSKMLLIIANISESLKNINQLDIMNSHFNKKGAEEISEIASIRKYIFLLLKEVEGASKAKAISQLSKHVDIRIVYL